MNSTSHFNQQNKFIINSSKYKIYSSYNFKLQNAIKKNRKLQNKTYRNFRHKWEQQSILRLQQYFQIISCYQNNSQVIKQIVQLQKVSATYAKNLQSFKNQVKYLHTIKKTANYLVRYINLLQTNNNYYVVLEYCREGDLKKKLKQKKFAFSQSFKFIRHILKGFIQLLKKGILHKNLKPKNILYHNGLMRISDFGLQNIIQAKTIYQNVDNHLYLAPQVLLGRRYTYKSDIWSLGLIIFQMIYGNLPWKTGRVLKVYFQRLQNEPLIIPNQIQVPEQLKKLILGCLKFKPEQRLQWGDIYNNPIFKDQFSLSFPQNYKFYYILSDLRKALMNSNLDLERYFQGKGILQQSQLKYKMFKQMIEALSYSQNQQQIFSQDDIKFLFDSFDLNGNGVIQFLQFKKALQQFQVSTFNFQGKRKQKKKELTTYGQILSLDKLQKLNIFIDRIIANLKKERIYDLYELYIQNDSNLDGIVDFKQFVKMVRKIDRFATDQQCRLLYQKIDQNSDNSINCSEFLKTMSILTGSPQKKRVT